MFWLQRQFNNIVETNARISLSLWMFEVSTASSNTSLQSLWEVLNRFVDRSLWQVAPDNLKRLLEFSNCLCLCFKLAVSFQHCIPHMIVHWVHTRRIWRPLVFGDEIWTIGPQPVLCTARRCALRRYVCADAPSCWKTNPVGSRQLL